MHGHTTDIGRPLPAPVARPWGTYQSIASDDGYQVKRIVVAPGGSLSRQRHARRAEHWVVVAGIATVELDGHEHELTPNQSIYIAQRAVHRLINRTTRPVVLIEVQYGDYLGEDDIERLDDIYGRVCRPHPLSPRLAINARVPPRGGTMGARSNRERLKLV